MHTNIPKEALTVNIQATIAAMTLEEKVGQLFVVRRPQEDERAMSAVTDYHIGGFTLYACDFEHRDPDSIRALLATYKDAARIPLLVAADEEGGRVSRAALYPAFWKEAFGEDSNREGPFPNPRTLDAMGGLNAVDTDTRAKAAFLLGLGINFNYAPVCDLSGNPACFIYDRTFSHDPAATAAYIDTVVRAMNDCHLVGSIKHFPGYGDNVDTHTSIARDDRSIEQFMTCDLEPFRAGIAAGAPIVMVAHNMVACMDPDNPASLSPTVHDLLRRPVAEGGLGFDGLIMTDSLDMNAITLFTGDRASAVQAVLSGNDLLCCTSYERQIPAVLEAVHNGTIPEARIDESVARVLRLKEAYGIL